MSYGVTIALQEHNAERGRLLERAASHLALLRDEDRREFLCLLRELREAGVTLEELGTMLGVSKQRVGQLLK